MEFRNLDEFWGYYMGQHSKSSTQRWHFAGTLCAIVCFLFATLSGRPWLMMLCPLSGYGMAWYSHLFVELNAPATFGHPLWSLFCDFKMFGLMLTGRLDREIKRLGKRPLTN